LSGACLTLSAKPKLAEDRENGYLEALNNEKNKMKRGESFTEELRAEGGFSVLFSVIPRFRMLESFRTPRKPPKRGRLSIRSLELIQRLKLSEKLERSVRIEL
jgi:hypothetical protein